MTATTGAGPDASAARASGGHVADLAPPGLLHLLLVRSTVAHARVTGLDVDAAREVPGVVAVLTAADLDARGVPALGGPAGRPVLATDTVRFQGQEVAAVVAETPYGAADAVELVAVDYEAAPVVTGVAEAGAGAAGGDPAGEVVVAFEAAYPRSHPAPIETAGCVAQVDRDRGRVTLHATGRLGPADRALVALAAGVPEDGVELVEPEAGRGPVEADGLQPGHLVAVVAAAVTGRPVRWLANRTEDLSAATPAHDCRLGGRLGVGADGLLAGAKLALVADAGAYPDGGWDGLPAELTDLVTATYGGVEVLVSVVAAATNTAPLPARPGGAARLAELALLWEGLLDRAARRLDLDPLELRLRNLAEGQPAEAARQAAAAIGYGDLRAGQAAARAGDALPGVAVATFSGPAAPGSGGAGPLARPVAAVAVAVEVDPGSGAWTVGRMALVHNLEGAEAAILAGVAEGFGLASMQSMGVDEHGNLSGATFMDYLLPTAWEVPRPEVARLTATGSGVAAGDAAAYALVAAVTVPALAGAVADALAHLGAGHVDLPMTDGRVWDAIHR